MQGPSRHLVHGYLVSFESAARIIIDIAVNVIVNLALFNVDIDEVCESRRRH